MMLRNVRALRWALSLVFLFLMGPSTQVFGLSLDEAKHQGLVGEQPNGYLGIVGASPAQDIQGLVTNINLQRREKYREIAERINPALQAVEVLAGKTAISKTQPGHFIQLPSGQWVKK